VPQPADGSDVKRRAKAKCEASVTSVTTAIGLAAAVCTTASYLPQLKKAWSTGDTRDLSLRMLLMLLAGLCLWIVYGVLQGDAMIVLANAVSVALLCGILYCKLTQDSASPAPERANDRTS
jgi:MtN3 and saliva related transmembrane protein